MKVSGRRWEPSFKSKSTKSVLCELCLGDDQVMSRYKAVEKARLVKSRLKITSLGVFF